MLIHMSVGKQLLIILHADKEGESSQEREKVRELKRERKEKKKERNEKISVQGYWKPISKAEYICSCQGPSHHHSLAIFFLKATHVGTKESPQVCEIHSFVIVELKLSVCKIQPWQILRGRHNFLAIFYK